MARKTSFYYSFLVLPADQRRAIIAVWDFCRAVDDAVDEAEPEPKGAVRSPREAIAYWRAELARCYGAGGDSAHAPGSIGVALYWQVLSFFMTALRPASFLLSPRPAVVFANRQVGR